MAQAGSESERDDPRPPFYGLTDWRAHGLPTQLEQASHNRQTAAYIEGLEERMAVETVQRAHLHWDWKNPPGEREIAALNEDFRKMDLPLKVSTEYTADGATFTFTKESSE
jgi:hypothetical protein